MSIRILAKFYDAFCAFRPSCSYPVAVEVEAVQAGYADVALKGKIRTILLPGKLCRKLQKCARKQEITSGEFFLTRSGKGVSRSTGAEHTRQLERLGLIL